MQSVLKGVTGCGAEQRDVSLLNKTQPTRFIHLDPTHTVQHNPNDTQLQAAQAADEVHILDTNNMKVKVKSWNAVAYWRK